MTRLARIASLFVALVPGASLAADLPPGPADAWFDDRVITVQAVGSLGDPADDATTHVVYTSTVRLPGGADEPFIPVLETLPGEVDDDIAWAEVEIIFTHGIMPRQLTSSVDVLAAMAAGDVVLAPTGTRYNITLLNAGSDDPQGNRVVRGDLLKPIAVPEAGPTVTWGYVKGVIGR